MEALRVGSTVWAPFFSTAAAAMVGEGTGRLRSLHMRDCSMVIACCGEGTSMARRGRLVRFPVSRSGSRRGAGTGTSTSSTLTGRRLLKSTPS